MGFFLNRKQQSEGEEALRVAVKRRKEDKRQEDSDDMASLIDDLDELIKELKIKTDLLKKTVRENKR